jgi:hypothetical protein
MASSDMYAMVGEPGTPERHTKMHCAIWRMSPRTHVFIGAPDLDSLEQCWKEITGLDLDRHQAQYVHVFGGKARDAAAAETSQS